MNAPTKSLSTDITRCIARDKASTALAKSREKLHQDIDRAVDGLVPFDVARIGELRGIKVAANEAEAVWGRVPRGRRELAQGAIKLLDDVRNDARRIGGDYSGHTCASVSIGDSARAETITEHGDRYSRRCTYRKTDAAHVVTVTADGLAWMSANPDLCDLSRSEGLPLIDLGKNGTARWLVSVGKRINSRTGWIVADRGQCYHSTESWSRAQEGLVRKLAKLDRERAEAAERERARRASPEYKSERRARLVARLCAGATATVADATALGYCMPGIDAFRAAHGIGDTASLPQLCRTGDPRAVRLALTVARRINGGAQ